MTRDLRLDKRWPTFSFYLSQHQCKTKPQIVRSIAGLAHAVTIAGPAGPERFRRLRDSGLRLPVLFDGLGYIPDQERLDPEDWVHRQLRVGSARPLLPGIYLSWDTDNSEFAASVQEQSRIASALGAAILIALDSRWLARRSELTIEALRSADAPVALVLAHRADPLSPKNAVQGLRRLASRMESLSLHRSDHGAIGALAFGAEHASIGLMTSTRHYATRAMRPWRRQGPSARLFIRPLLDWFLASEVAGWTAAGKDIICPLPCCKGMNLAQFDDPDSDETWHNMNAIADFATYICNATASDREVEFLQQCRAAALRYGLAGFDGPEKPKAQLTGWVLS